MEKPQRLLGVCDPAGERGRARFVRWADPRPVSGRVCAIKKSRQAAEKAKQKVRRQAQKGGYKVKRETLKAAEYLFVFTTIPRDRLKPRAVLELYRGRWQIELVFKRLKSIVTLSYLRKYDPQAARSWLHGKLFVAFVVHAVFSFST